MTLIVSPSEENENTMMMINDSQFCFSINIHEGDFSAQEYDPDANTAKDLSYRQNQNSKSSNVLFFARGIKMYYYYKHSYNNLEFGRIQVD